MRKLTAVSAVAALFALGMTAAQAQTQGVSKGEIVIGSMQDLSGPIVAFSKQLKFGMEMRVDEINAAGGINGRKLKLIVEDHGYDPKKAVLATQKLVQKDKIFAMVGTIGTPTALPSMPILFDKNIPHLFPLTAAREMYEPLHRLKYSFAATYFDQMRAGVKHIVKAKGYKKVCTMYQDDDFGLEVMRGAEAGLKEVNMVLAEKTTFKRGATDFSSQVARMKAANCDLVVLGTIIRETIGTIAEGRKTGFNPTYLGSSATYTDLIHKLGKKAMDGLYATHTVQHPYMDEASPKIQFWAKKYQTKFGDDPTVFSVYGYSAVDTFIAAAQKAGANLTVDSFIKAMESTTFAPDMFGSAELTFSPTKRAGSNMTRMSQLQDERWKPVTDYVKPQ